MGSAIGKRLAASGHTVVFGSRFPAENAVRFTAFGDISVKSYAQAAAGAELRVAVQAMAIGLVVSLKQELAGKIIVDLITPASVDFSQLVPGGSDSAVAQIARAEIESNESIQWHHRRQLSRPRFQR
jgi:predicted dinucleotide-binding enzyme